MTGTDWTAVGSLATAAAALIALVSLWVASRGRRAREAAEIRERIQAFVTECHRLVALLNEGTPLISAAWHTAESLRTQAGENATADTMRELIGDPSVAVMASVEGWVSSPATGQLRVALAELMATGERLPGHLSLFSPVAALLRKIVGDGYSNTTFMRLLNEEPARRFLATHQEDELDDLTRALASHILGAATGYFLARYSNALAGLTSFVDTAAAAFADLEPADLVRAERAKTPILGATYTEEFRARIDRMTGLLPRDTLDELRAQVGVLEVEISKDSAIERLTAEQLEA